MTSLPNFIRTSGYCTDLAQEKEAKIPGSRWFYPPNKPVGGQEVMVGVTFHQPMKVVTSGKESTWCILGGRVRSILSDQRFIARIQASPYQAPAELGGVFDGLLVRHPNGSDWTLESLTPRPDKQLEWALPAFVREGFNRDDTCRQNEAGDAGKRRWLYEGQEPEVGQLVKVQLKFHQPMPAAGNGALSPWCLLGGVVEEVVDDDELRISVEPTSDNAPSEAGGTWKGTLVYDRQRDLPWVLTRLERVPGTK